MQRDAQMRHVRHEHQYQRSRGRGRSRSRSHSHSRSRSRRRSRSRSRSPLLVPHRQPSAWSELELEPLEQSGSERWQMAAPRRHLTASLPCSPPPPVRPISLCLSALEQVRVEEER